MKSLFSPVLVTIFTGLLQGEELKLWQDDRITPEQPFPARVVGVQAGWAWDTLILREVNGTRHCLATFGNPLGTYKIIEAKNFDRSDMIKKGAVFLTPGIEVSRFTWSMGIWKHGKKFGEEDFATKYFRQSNKPERKSE